MFRRMVSALAFLGLIAAVPAHANPGPRHATIYKDPNCGCCQGYADHLRNNGFTVEVRTTVMMSAIKRRYNVPGRLSSCHTMRIGGYTVEGHVPVGTVKKLLRERPKINGISLPGMPQGSPGMPGQKLEPFVVYELGGGTLKTFNVE